jgi:phosphomannomutase/phosphoglucomutase
MTTALMLDCLAGRGMSFSKVLSFVVPKFYQAKTKVDVAGKKIEAIMRAVERQAKGEVEKVDGIKVWTSEHSWVLVRPSGTEPIVRIFAEAETQEGADQLVKKFAKVVNSAST